MTPRQIAQACRCQLLTGSYDGATRSCACTCKGECAFTAEEREELKDHKKVIKARKRNQKEYLSVGKFGSQFSSYEIIPKE